MPRQAFVFIMITSLALGACAVGPNFHTPAAPSTQTYTATPLHKTVSAQGQTQYFNAGQSIPVQWWTLFHSPALDALVCKGLANSPTLAAAQATLRQAQENLNAEVGSALFPGITAGLGASRQRNFSSTSTDERNHPRPSLYNLFNASVNVSYALDIFGGARRELEFLQAQVDYQRFQLEAAYLTLAANIVTTAITEAALREQIKSTHTLIRSQENSLALVNTQFTLGSEPQATVLAQQTLLAQTRATLSPLQKSLAQTRDALAVLVGTVPSKAELPEFSLSSLHLPTQLPLNLPSSLLRQRPDVRASEALYQSASAQIGVATATLFPLVSMTGNYGSITTLSNGLFKAGAGVWGLGAQALQPLLNGGALRAKRRGVIAAYDQAAAHYQQTVLLAFQNVADTLHALAYDAQTLNAQIAAEAAARLSWKLTKKQYELGAISYLALLDAERQYQQTSINRIQAQALRYADTAALFQALGGGWWHKGK